MSELRENVREIGGIVSKLDPRAVEDEVDVMTGSRVQAWAAKGALARSAEQALPLPDHVDRFVRRKMSDYAGLVEVALIALRRASEVQDELLARLTLAEASDLVEAELGPSAATCANRNCARTWIPTATDRLIAGRCFACYEYRRRHAGEDAPRDVCEARLDAHTL